jgi:hypothetical protein
VKRFTVVFLAAILIVGVLAAPAIAQPRGGHVGWGGYHGGYHGAYHGPYRGHPGWGYRGGFYLGFSPFYWGVGWPYAGWPYAYYGGWPYVGWPYYPSAAPAAPPAYNAPEQPQPYYWYYCQDPQGYYPYVKSCPGGWIPVTPNVNPPVQ